MKINIKKVVILIAIILILVISIVLIILKITQNTNNDIESKESKTATIGENSIVIESNEKNKIEKNEIEAEKVEINFYGNQLEIKTVLKNNSKNVLKGDYISISLLDSDNNTIHRLVHYFNEQIEPGESKELTTYLVDIENATKIRNAKIEDIVLKEETDPMEEMVDESEKITQEEFTEDDPTILEETTPNAYGPQPNDE